MARREPVLRRRMVTLGLLGALSVGLQFSTGSLGSVDGYFHARYAAIVRAAGLHGFPPPFPWLPLTIRSADRYYDHHMLFHVLLAPFTAGDIVRGVKSASALFGAAAFVAVYAVLLRRRVPGAEWWLAAMVAVAPDFLYRMQMPRVQALSLLCLLGATELSLARRWIGLVPLAIIYTWLYDAFPFVLLISGTAALAIAVFERRVEWRAVAYPLIGIAIGLVANPYFPNDVWFVAHHYVGKVDIGTTMRLGTEWYPYPVAEWLGWGGAIAALATAAVVAWRGRRRIDAPALTLLLIAAGFFVLAWRSRRFIEYAAPFVLLALATSLSRWVGQAAQRMRPRALRAGAVILLLGCAVSAFIAARQLSRRPPPTRYAGGAAWLVDHTPAGAIVFTPDWDDFPLLFFHDQHNRYVIGLDPAYLAQQDAARYRLWRQLGHGELTPPSRFLPQLETSVVLTDHAHTQFIAALQSDPDMERVFEDGECLIFRRRG